MPAIILDGKKIAAEIRAEVTVEIQGLRAAGVRPGLAVVLVGSNPASAVYVRQKVKACEEIGIHSETHAPPQAVSNRDLVALINQLNQRDEIDGILVQLPLPSQVDMKQVLITIDPAKDVDGFHPMNVGFLSTQLPGLVPCTPAGILEILKRSRIPIAGQEAVTDVRAKQATDRREFDKFSRANEQRHHSTTKSGSTLMGDVPPRVVEVAGAVTAVPGRVGPLTTTMLMRNTGKEANLGRGA